MDRPLRRWNYASTGMEFHDRPAPLGFHGLHHVPQDAVDRVLVEDAHISVGRDVGLEALELQHVLHRLVLDHDGPEVRQARLGAYGVVFGVLDGDDVTRELVGKSLQRRQGGVQTRLGVFFVVSRQFRTS